MKRRNQTFSLLLLAAVAPVWAAPPGEAPAPRGAQGARSEATFEDRCASIVPQFRQALLRRISGETPSREGLSAMHDARFYMPALDVRAAGQPIPWHGVAADGRPLSPGDAALPTTGWLRQPRADAAAGVLPRWRY